MLSADNPVIRLAFDSIRESLKVISESIHRWWGECGFYGIVKESFSAKGEFQATLSFSLEYTDKPDTRRRNFISRGFVFADEIEHRWLLVDNDINRKLLRQLLSAQYPSMKVVSWNNKIATIDGEDAYVLTGLDIIVKNIEEMI